MFLALELLILRAIAFDTHSDSGFGMSGMELAYSVVWMTTAF